MSFNHLSLVFGTAYVVLFIIAKLYPFKSKTQTKKIKIGEILSFIVALVGLLFSQYDSYQSSVELSTIKNNTEQILRVLDSNIDEVIADRPDVYTKETIFFADIQVYDKDTDMWTHSIDAEIGDIVEFQGVFINMSDKTTQNVMIRNVLPDNLSYIEDSTMLYNSNYQEGVIITDNTLTTNGINIGSYLPDGNAYVRFKTIVQDKNMSKGLNQLVNWITITSQGKVLYNEANVFVEKR